MWGQAFTGARRNLLRGWAILVKKPSMRTDRNLHLYSGIIPVSLFPIFKLVAVFFLPQFPYLSNGDNDSTMVFPKVDVKHKWDSMYNALNAGLAHGCICSKHNCSHCYSFLLLSPFCQYLYFPGWKSRILTFMWFNALKHRLSVAWISVGIASYPKRPQHVQWLKHNRASCSCNRPCRCSWLVVHFLPPQISENLIFYLWFLHLLGLLTTYSQQAERESAQEAHLLLKHLGYEVTDITSDHILMVGTSLMETSPRNKGPEVWWRASIYCHK